MVTYRAGDTVLKGYYAYDPTIVYCFGGGAMLRMAREARLGRVIRRINLAACESALSPSASSPPKHGQCINFWQEL
ncbi:MAG TPA: hypothetical protein VHK27_01875, partial [Gammaproteobacteria bacterium]|nr:hypothetical protein [Gammaproteobacteria bacterium]